MDGKGGWLAVTMYAESVTTSLFKIIMVMVTQEISELVESLIPIVSLKILLGSTL